jgi:hypothetical protein
VGSFGFSRGSRLYKAGFGMKFNFMNNHFCESSNSFLIWLVVSKRWKCRSFPRPAAIIKGLVKSGFSGRKTTLASIILSYPIERTNNLIIPNFVEGSLYIGTSKFVIRISRFEYLFVILSTAAVGLIIGWIPAFAVLR